MVDVFPGLRGRIRDRFGGAGPLRALGHQFGDWLERGQHANPATVVRVETALARYLADAANVGRWWGAAAGVVGGLGAALVVTVAAWIWQVWG
ncbi:hypothetical protein GA0074692_3852 [Micromonospora pallida]|uniref:Uncharacterized protein n=1 Tax=Micromonospora pallida TaxID=145854 RepID=A0A1C6SYE9_9ACTN|nr:hypothetical protein [Micromonospora pallida]SCL34520.1 hypothetical protein GA0074692_3852 [Micromonospora pallida]